MTSYRHRCTLRKPIRINISTTRHSILITARGQLHTVSFFDSTGSALVILISRTEPQRRGNISGRVVTLMNLSTTISATNTKVLLVTHSTSAPDGSCLTISTSCPPVPGHAGFFPNARWYHIDPGETSVISLYTPPMPLTH